FAAGVPILRRGPDLMLQVGAAEFLVPLADHEIATWFRPERLDDESTHASWRHGRPLYYGDQQITGTDDPPFRTAIAKQIIEGGALLSFAGACGRFTLRSEGDDHLANAGLYSMKGPKDAIPKMARNFDPDMMARNAGILGVMQQEGGGQDRKSVV